MSFRSTGLTCAGAEWPFSPPSGGSVARIAVSLYEGADLLRPAVRKGAEFLFMVPDPSGKPKVKASKVFHTAITAVTAYRVVKAAKRIAYDGYFASEQPEIFTSVENPLCTSCRPELVDLEMPNAIAEAKFVAPTRCLMCSWLPGIYALEACCVKIDSPAHQCLVNFTELKNVKDSRDIHGPLINTIDSRPSQDFKLQLFQSMLPKIIALQRRKVSFLDNLRCLLLQEASFTIAGWTKCQRFCGPFQSLGAGSVQPSPAFLTAQALLARLRRIWDFVSLHGAYPVTTVLDGPRTVLNRLVGRPVPDMTMHAQIVEEQAELNASASPGPGETSAFVSHEAAHVTGPIVVPTTVLNPEHVSRGVEIRTQVQLDPRTGQPLQYDRKSRTAQIYQMFWARIQKELFSRERILRIYSKIMSVKEIRTKVVIKDGHHQEAELVSKEPVSRELGEYGLSKFGKEIIDDALSNNQMIRSPELIKMRVAHGKWEQIAKDGKTVRSVIDNGVELLTMVHIFGEVYSEAIFGEDSPFHTMNIKHQDRAACLDQFVKFNAGDFGEPMLMWEVDQTSMEAHMRVPGPLEPILKAMQNIANICCQKFSGQLGAKYAAKISYDIEKGMRISIEVRGVTVPGSKKKAVLKFPDFYLDSGWMLTAAANFSGELTTTMSCFCEDPWHVFAKDESGRYHINVGTFNYTYQSRPFPTQGGKPWVPTKIKFNGLIEGDDGGGGASRSIVGDGSAEAIEATKTQLTYYMADVGMSAKFVLQIDGRVEIIGAHMKAINGRLDITFPWCPDIRRYLGKIGSATQTRQPTTDEGRTILAASRLISIASMFRGNVEKLHDAFTNLAMYHYNKLSTAAKLKQYRVQVWSAEEMAGVTAGITCLKSTFETMEAKGSAVQYPTQSTQELMILNSLKLAEPGHNVMGKLDIWSQDLSNWDGDHEAFYRQLPEIFKA